MMSRETSRGTASVTKVCAWLGLSRARFYGVGKPRKARGPKAPPGST